MVLVAFPHHRPNLGTMRELRHKLQLPERRVARKEAGAPGSSSSLSPSTTTGGRKRKTRFMRIDGHTVLKANNYGLEDGISTFSNSARSQRRRALSKIRAAQNPYALFMAEEKLNLSTAPAAWATLAPSAKEEYKEKAARDKIRFQQETEAREALLVRLDLEDAQAAAARDEAEERERAEKIKAAERKMARLQEDRQQRRLLGRRTSKLSAERKVIVAHNQMVRAEIAKRDCLRSKYLSEHAEVLRPFVGEALLRKLGLSNPESSSFSTSLRPDPSDVPQHLTETPDFIRHGKLRDYQLRGVNWLVEMHHRRGTNAILADEMGLGKTLQTVTFLAYLKYRLDVVGPSLIVVPLSVLTSWCNEFKRWCPSMRVMQFHSSDAGDRDRMKTKLMRDPLSIDVVLSTYEMMVSPNTRHIMGGRSVKWRYVVIDEGHKIKNEMSQISEQMARVGSEGRIILTGTPLQNNLHELWALLRYLVPGLFLDSTVFDKAFDVTHNVCNPAMLDQAHHLLRVFQLRRLKVEVERLMPKKHEMNLIVKLSPAQQFWAKKLLLRDARMLAQMEADLQGTGLACEGDDDDEAFGDGSSESSDAWKRLNSLLMQMRKVCNHPYLLPGGDPGATAMGTITDDDIVMASNKMLLLDRLLVRLFKGGHRVVLFSQFTSMLDIFEDYLTMRGYKYVRLDGSCSRAKRNCDLRVFNAEGSPVFVFLMSTRAGGLGINAQTADTVILYDSDWNPQVDQQAMARVHRIGQEKKVHIYRLITGDSVEERIIQRAEKKLFMDKMVNRDSTRQAMEFEKLGKKEMLKMLKFGAHAVFGGHDPTAESLGDGKDMAGTSNLDSIDIGIPLSSMSELMDRNKDWDSSKNAAEFNAELPPVAIRDMLSEEIGQLKKRPSFREIGQEWQKVLATKRKRVNRIVRVDGRHNVLRENDYAVKGGAYVFGNNTTPPAGHLPKSYTKGARKQLTFEHSNVCNICWDGGELICCDSCPASYHEACLTAHGLMGSSARGIMKDTFVCPHHKCSVCGRSSSAAGGLIIACTECPNAFCEEHESTGLILSPDGCDRWQKLGQPRRAATTTYFCQCSKACQKFHSTRVAQGVSAAIKEQKAEAQHNAQKQHSGAAAATLEILPDRVLIPPTVTHRSKLGTVVDYDGFLWYICRNGDTVGEVAYNFNMDAQKLLYQNRSIDRLSRVARLHKFTPLLLERGKTAFLPPSKAQRLLDNPDDRLAAAATKKNKTSNASLSDGGSSDSSDSSSESSDEYDGSSDDSDGSSDNSSSSSSSSDSDEEGTEYSDEYDENFYKKGDVSNTSASEAEELEESMMALSSSSSTEEADNRNSKVIHPKLACLGAPALKKIAKRLSIPIVLGRSPAEWRNVISANPKFEKHPDQYMASSSCIPEEARAEPLQKRRKTELAKKVDKKSHEGKVEKKSHEGKAWLPYGNSQIFEVAACKPDHVGPWEGIWESCTVLGVKYNSHTTRVVSTIVPVHSKLLGVRIHGLKVVDLLEQCAESILTAGAAYGDDVTIIAVEGQAVTSGQDLLEKLASVKTRPIHIHFRWSERDVASYDVKIVSDGMVCPNIPAHFVRHKFRSKCMIEMLVI